MFLAAINKWTDDIEEHVGKSRASKQRRARTTRGKNNKQENLVQIQDITHTHAQYEYGNVNMGNMMSMLLSDGEINKHCFVDGASPQRDLEAMFHKYFQEKDNEIGAFVDAQAMFIAAMMSADGNTKIDNFIDDALGSSATVDFLGDGDVELNKERFRNSHREFLVRSFIPDSLKTSTLEEDTVFKLVQLIQDTKLRDSLYSAMPAQKHTIDRFLSNRVTGEGSEISPMVRAELADEFQDYDFDSETNLNRCVLMLFHGIKQTLLTGSLRDSKSIKLPKGIDRRYLPASYAALVRPERAKAAIRQAMGAYTSGLSLIAKGLAGKSTKAKNNNYLISGYAKIFNIRDREFQQSNVQSDKHRINTTDSCDKNSMCGELRKKTSASSAILLAYFELVDCMLTPSSPLMLRSDMMRVKEVYVSPGGGDEDRTEPFDVENADVTWSSHKFKAYKNAYMRLERKWKAAGFSPVKNSRPNIIGKIPLNIDQWGHLDSWVVPNPFRVREDSYLHKLLGAFRIEPNRLGIGPDAAEIWKEHVIGYTFDPRYCNQFLPTPGFSPNTKKGKIERAEIEIRRSTKSFPRPILPLGVGPLYTNLSSFDVVQDSRLRERINEGGMTEWIKTLDGSANFKEKYPEEKKNSNNAITMSSIGKAMYDIHIRFRTSPMQMPMKKGETIKPYTVVFDNRPELLYVSEDGFGQGLKRNEPGWLLDSLFTGQKRQRQNGINEKIILACQPPVPPLNELIHPVEMEEISLLAFVDMKDFQLLENDFDSDYDFEKDDLFAPTGAELVYHNMLTNHELDLRGLPSWVDTAKQPLISYPYPLANRSGDLLAPVTAVTYSEDGKYPYRQDVTGGFRLFLPEMPNFWDLRNSLVLLLDTPDLFEKITTLQKLV
jgi:hypothetical protein